MTIMTAKFALGQLVNHRLFDYRGVIIGVDADYQGTDEWYDQVAKSRPPKDRPWYQVLVDKVQHQTYVAEQNLSLDDSDEPIQHPMVDIVFSKFDQGVYKSRTVCH